MCLDVHRGKPVPCGGAAADPADAGGEQAAASPAIKSHPGDAGADGFSCGGSVESPSWSRLATRWLPPYPAGRQGDRAGRPCPEAALGVLHQGQHPGKADDASAGFHTYRLRDGIGSSSWLCSEKKRSILAGAMGGGNNPGICFFAAGSVIVQRQFYVNGCGMGCMSNPEPE